MSLYGQIDDEENGILIGHPPGPAGQVPRSHQQPPVHAFRLNIIVAGAFDWQTSDVETKHLP